MNSHQTIMPKFVTMSALSTTKSLTDLQSLTTPQDQIRTSLVKINEFAIQELVNQVGKSPVFITLPLS